MTVHPWPQVFYSSTDHEYQLGVDGVEVESFERRGVPTAVDVDVGNVGWRVGIACVRVR